jgi:peroxiredoxin
MRRILTAFLAAFGLMAFVTMPPVTSANGPEIGSTVESFSLPDTEGKIHTLDSLKGKNGTVIVWLSAQCPVVAAYKDRINEIAAAYKEKGIAFIGINSNATEDLTWVRSNLSEFGYQFPVLIDKDGALAEKLGATVTPEAYFLDKKNILLYHGAIDNDRSGKNVQERFLKTAFDSALAGKSIEKTKTAAFGCSIKRAGKPAE